MYLQRFIIKFLNRPKGAILKAIEASKRGSERALEAIGKSRGPGKGKKGNGEEEIDDNDSNDNIDNNDKANNDKANNDKAKSAGKKDKPKK